ncbi:MAG: DUF6399 domain-containing protein [Elainellaceae cyanobacterium]
MPSTIREHRQKVAFHLRGPIQQSLQAIAQATGLSRSSVHRHRQAIERHRQYPESEWWDTPVGYDWLVRLVVAVVYHFGIKQGVGAESLSDFFKAIHLQQQVGCSASALRTLKGRLMDGIIDYAAAQGEHCQPVEQQGICVGADETFFERPILVMVELVSGFIFIETESDNRTYDTWQQQWQKRWGAYGWQCHYLVSDAAPALIKLALSGLGCPHVVDVFHALRDLGRPWGRAIERQLQQVQQQVADVQQQLKSLTEGSQRQALLLTLAQLAQQQQDWHAAQEHYRQALETIGQSLHPFELECQRWQLDGQLAASLAAPLGVLSQLAQAMGSQPTRKALATFEAQLSTWATGIRAWRQWCEQALMQETPDPARQSWVLHTLLPWVYWSIQLDKARQPCRQQRYQQAASDAYDRLWAHPLTLQLSDAEVRYWRNWAVTFVANYQRTSSAVEGRNGCLSKLHHATRGFSAQSLEALTVIHNFDLRRADGSTAAQRLFNHEFPDLFECLLLQVGDLPLPRRSSKAQRLSG